jgi:hypothetical protein
VFYLAVLSTATIYSVCCELPRHWSNDTDTDNPKFIITIIIIVFVIIDVDVAVVIQLARLQAS